MDFAVLPFPIYTLKSSRDAELHIYTYAKLRRAAEAAQYFGRLPASASLQLPEAFEESRARAGVPGFSSDCSGELRFKNALRFLLGFRLFKYSWVETRRFQEVEDG